MFVVVVWKPIFPIHYILHHEFVLHIDGRRLTVTKLEEKEEIESENNNEKSNRNPRWKKQEEALQSEESIAESGRMFVRNLSYTTTEDDIRNIFEKYGKLSASTLIMFSVTLWSSSWNVAV